MTIDGSGFLSVTEVDFAGISASFTANSDTSISATVPNGATTGPVDVVSSGGAVASSQDQFTVQPNMVLILTDDQRMDEVSDMQTLQSAIISKGETFKNGYVVDPLCCPSRTTILTGKYSHSTDVYDNRPPHGGFATFTGNGGDQSTIATWLDDAGYDTALVGKYLNGYGPKYADHIPPGWDTWDALANNTHGGYFNYYMSVQGKLRYYGNAETDYSTDVFAGFATDFINSVPPSRPLFLYFATKAPHKPATTPPRYTGTYTNFTPRWPPNYNEADVSDKPSYIQAHSPLSATAKANMRSLMKRQLQTVLAVDDAIKAIRDTLKATGRLSSTFIVFASDNGLQIGSHRWQNKKVPYEESSHVPIVVRYDPLTQQQPMTSDQFVLNLDFAPTFADVAQVSPPADVEGRSFLSLLDGTATGWRTGFLIEHANAASGKIPPYCAVRNTRYKYVKYADGFEELYDLQNDQYELDNLLVTMKGDPGYSDILQTRDAMYARLLVLCSPPPPGFTP